MVTTTGLQSPKFATATDSMAKQATMMEKLMEHVDSLEKQSGNLPDRNNAGIQLTMRQRWQKVFRNCQRPGHNGTCKTVLSTESNVRAAGKQQPFSIGSLSADPSTFLNTVELAASISPSSWIQAKQSPSSKKEVLERIIKNTPNALELLSSTWN